MAGYYSTQKTIGSCIEFSGIGLHTGQSSRVKLEPAKVDHGIEFLKNSKSVCVLGQSTVDSDGVRCSAVGRDGQKILTIEHFLAALSGLGITNLRVDVQGDEMPIMDGSAKSFVDLFTQSKIVDQHDSRFIFKVKEPIFVGADKKAIALYPADEFKVSYVLDYPFEGLRDQRVDFTISQEVFTREVAPARTFCTVDEMDIILKSGLGKGGNYQNNLVIGPDGPIDNQLRFADECARHKVLDIIGDLSLAGFWFLGHVIAIRSGHALNRQLVSELIRQKESY